jgi:dTDP-4-amino-4,6-dideoxygalactose transaminase
LTEGLKGLSGLHLPIIKADCTHAYYVFPMTLDIDQLGVPREKIVAALEAEGVAGLAAGYANVHLLPMYQRKIAYGSKGFPWTSDICKREVSYAKGICPVAEGLHDKTFLGYEMCLNELEDGDVELIVTAFKKVWAAIGHDLI